MYYHPTLLFTVFVLFQQAVLASPPPEPKQLLGKDYLVTKLYYDDAVNYYTKLSIGTPPQMMNLLVDIGISVSWVKCSPCDGECATNKFFHGDISETLAWIPCKERTCLDLEKAVCFDHNKVCEYYQEDRDGAEVRMLMAFETFTIEKVVSQQEISSVPFGCGTNFNEDVKLDGILGLGPGKLSFYQFLKNNYGVNMFSYCLLDQIKNANASSDILFGDQPVSPRTLYTPMVHHNEHYMVMLSGIKIDGEALESSYPIKMALNTGNTNTNLPGPVFKALSEKIMGAVDKLAWGRAININGNFLCYNVNRRQLSESPTITISFGGDAKLLLLHHHIWQYIPDTQMACFAFQPTDGEDYYIGSMQQQGTRVIIDQRNDEERIGFETLAC